MRKFDRSQYPNGHVPARRLPPRSAVGGAGGAFGGAFSGGGAGGCERERGDEDGGNPGHASGSYGVGLGADSIPNAP